MKTLIATATLTVMFLSAGAFASDGQSPVTSKAQSGNITVIVKNQAWPLPGQVQPDPCEANRCIDI